VIMDVEATTAIRQAEVSAAKTMLDRIGRREPMAVCADYLVERRGFEPTAIAGRWEISSY
jgi:hypothetical protein